MQEVVALYDEHAEALNFLAYAYAEDNRNLEEALVMAEKALALKDAAHILDTLGWVYYRLGRLDQALEIITLARQKLPDDEVVLEHLGDIQRALNNYEAARLAYQEALELDPENVTIQNKLKNLQAAD